MDYGYKEKTKHRTQGLQVKIVWFVFLIKPKSCVWVCVQVRRTWSSTKIQQRKNLVIKLGKKINIKFKRLYISKLSKS